MMWWHKPIAFVSLILFGKRARLWSSLSFLSSKQLETDINILAMYSFSLSFHLFFIQTGKQVVTIRFKGNKISWNFSRIELIRVLSTFQRSTTKNAMNEWIEMNEALFLNILFTHTRGTNTNTSNCIEHNTKPVAYTSPYGVVSNMTQSSKRERERWRHSDMENEKSTTA